MAQGGTRCTQVHIALAPIDHRISRAPSVCCLAVSLWACTASSRRNNRAVAGQVWLDRVQPREILLFFLRGAGAVTGGLQSPCFQKRKSLHPPPPHNPGTIRQVMTPKLKKWRSCSKWEAPNKWVVFSQNTFPLLGNHYLFPINVVSCLAINFSQTHYYHWSLHVPIRVGKSFSSHHFVHTADCTRRGGDCKCISSAMYKGKSIFSYQQIIAFTIKLCRVFEVSNKLIYNDTS